VTVVAAAAVEVAVAVPVNQKNAQQRPLLQVPELAKEQEIHWWDVYFMIIIHRTTITVKLTTTQLREQRQ
jgi:hypothetical protein